jgi:hypothetical protein
MVLEKSGQASENARECAQRAGFARMREPDGRLPESHVSGMDNTQRSGNFRLHRAAVTVLCLMAFLLLGQRPAHASCSSNTATTANIHAISVDLPGSPYLNCEVTTTGIVIAVLSDGFYIENQSGWDSNTCSSEGIYVYTGATTPASLGIALQQSVTVTGLVEASNSSSYAGVQIYVASPVVGSSGTIIINSSGNTLPSTVTSSTLTQATSGTCSSYGVDSFGQWLPFEGMRVNIPSSSSLLVTQGTGGTVNAATQTATTNGQFWAVVTTTRPFRATGINLLDPAEASAPSGVTIWGGNPQLLLVDSTTLGGTALDASAGTEYTGSSELVGIVDYHVSTQGYTGLLLTSSSVSALSSQIGATPVKASDRLSTDQITFATLDLNSLVASETNRITKLGNAIVNYMKSPDVLAMQGATPAALTDLLSAISTAGGPGYDIVTESTADTSGLVDTFLVNPANFDGAPTVTQALAVTTFSNSSGTSELLFNRSPLVLTAKIPRKGISDFKLSVVNVSLLPRTNLSSATLSEDARIQREQQAENLTTQVLEPLETAGDHVMLLGGLNSFEFSDGYVDTTGILAGSEATSGTVWLYDSTTNSSTLINSTTAATNLTAAATNPATSRYTYVESGSAEQPDHILYTSEMSSLFSLDYARIGADFPVSETYTTSTVARATSHDGVVAYFTVPYPTTTTVTSTPNPSTYDEAVTFTATVKVTGDTSGSAGTPDGTVTFTDSVSGATLGTATLSSGVATFSYSKLTVGTHTITASYGGSETNLGYQSSSGTVSQVVNQDVAALVLVSSTNPSYYGQPVTFTATASSSGEVPTGTVTFYDNGTSIGTGTLSSGVTTLITSSLSIGTHSIKAIYGGDTTDTTATSNTVSQVVTTNTTTVTVASSENPSYYGDSVTFTATAVGSYGTPSGTVTFYDASTSTTLGTATLVAGTATYTASTTSAAITSLSVGSHTIQAIYATDGTNAAATGSLTQVVKTNTTTLMVVSSAPTIYYGHSVTFTVTAVGASGVPTGSISILVDGVTTYAATLTAGASASTASVPTTTLAVGTHSITAHYGGDGTHATADSTAIQQVVLPTYATTSTLACTPLIAEIGASVSCTDSIAASTGQPAGTITYYDGTTALGTATVTAGSASFTLAGLAVGAHAITAVFVENDPYLASTSNTQNVIIESTFTLTATPTTQTIYTGEATSYTITVTPGTGFTLDVALACSGLPANTTCTMTPSTVSGGSGASTLTIQTTAPQQETTARLERSGGGALLAGLVLLFVPRRWRRKGAWLAVLVVGLTLGTLTGCGGSGTLTGGTPAGSYTITVTGTSAISTLTITETTTTTLNVKSLF